MNWLKAPRTEQELGWIVFWLLMIVVVLPVLGAIVATFDALLDGPMKRLQRRRLKGRKPKNERAISELMEDMGADEEIGGKP